ncbi:MAG: DEAD/DEAH box helicase [Terriglobia bacterium]
MAANGNGFDPSWLVREAEPAKEEEKQHVQEHQFDDFAINGRLKGNIRAKGYSKPTPIQDKTISHILKGKDVVGMAETGTGKTAAFLVPLVDKIVKNRGSRVMIVVPTRELAIQIKDELRVFGRGLPVFAALLIGGLSIEEQIKKLQRRPSFVVGTPGRLKDLYGRRKLDFAHFSTIVLDEVDRMLGMGFIDDVMYIVDRLPKERQSLFFAATTTDSVKRVMKKFLRDPVTITVGRQRASRNVQQDIIRTGASGKIDVLYELLKRDGFDKVLVFGRTKWGTEKLARQLNKRGFRVASIHGNKSQAQRQRALKQFRDDRIQALIATDVASRGLDIDDVTHVINYDLPETYEDYIHRIGRTGRADKKGVALTLVVQ